MTALSTPEADVETKALSINVNSRLAKSSTIVVVCGLTRKSQSECGRTVVRVKTAVRPAGTLVDSSFAIGNEIISVISRKFFLKDIYINERFHRSSVGHGFCES